MKLQIENRRHIIAKGLNHISQFEPYFNRFNETIADLIMKPLSVRYDHIREIKDVICKSEPEAVGPSSGEPVYAIVEPEEIYPAWAPDVDPKSDRPGREFG